MDPARYSQNNNLTVADKGLMDDIYHIEDRIESRLEALAQFWTVFADIESVLEYVASLGEYEHIDAGVTNEAVVILEKLRRIPCKPE